MKTEFEQELLDSLSEDTEELLQADIESGLFSAPADGVPQNNDSMVVYITLALLGAIVVCIIFGSILLKRSAAKYISAVGESFRQTSNTVAEEAYYQFYQSSFNTAQAQSHVKNQVSISIGSLQEKAELQVLEVEDVEYAFGTLSNKEEKWLRAKGSAVFTVNLTVSEFLVDDARQYVLVRIPRPEAGSFDLNDEDISPQQSKSFVDQITGIFSGNHADEEIHLHDKLCGEAYAKLQKTVITSPEFNQVAKDNAVATITNMVKALNPDLPELRVEVEFFE